MTQMTSVPASLAAKKSMKMKFCSKKIYCNSSSNVLNIANMQNPKLLYMYFKYYFANKLSIMMLKSSLLRNPYFNFLKLF